MPTLKIGQIGAGLGGVSFAATLAIFMREHPEHDIELKLYESAPAFGEVGAAIGIGPYARDVLKYLGVFEEFEKISTSGLTQKYYWANDDTVRDIIPETPTVNQACHRARLLEILVGKLPEGIAHFNKRLRNYTVDESKETEKITLHFEDETTATCDVLVGSDGVKSQTRAMMFQDTGVDITAKYMGTDIHRCLVPLEKIAAIVGEKDAHHPHVYLGKLKRIMFREFLGTLSVVSNQSGRTEPGGPSGSMVDLDEYMANWKDASPTARKILQTVDNPSRWPLFEVPDLPYYYNKDNVVLLGDAAHAFLPHLGAGGSQALEDGLVLGTILGQPSVNLSNIQQALRTYSDCRLPRTQLVKHKSKKNGRVLNLIDDWAGEDLKKVEHQLRNGALIPKWTVIEAQKEAIDRLSGTYVEPDADTKLNGIDTKPNGHMQPNGMQPSGMTKLSDGLDNLSVNCI